ncbi:MAG: nucleotidyltransferase domain-containing protein [Pyrodictiaceae archaeon]
MRRGWPAYALERIKILAASWREAAEKTAQACLRILGSSCREVYVVGGVAENRITVFSDLDIVIVVDDPRLKTLETIIAVKREAEELGVPAEITLDIKLLEPGELKELVSKGTYKKLIKIK